MMMWCALGIVAIRLVIVLLGPPPQALGPGHAVAERHLRGFPLRRSLLYLGFAMGWGCWDTSAVQPRLKRKHPFLLLLLRLLSSSYFTVRNNTHSLWRFASLLLMPNSLLCLDFFIIFFIFLSAGAFLCLPPYWTGQTNSSLSDWKYTVIFSLTEQMQMTSDCDRQIATFSCERCRQVCKMGLKRCKFNGKGCFIFARNVRRIEPTERKVFVEKYAT